MPITAVDLFCGAGGLTRGLLDAGINVVAGIDFDANCRYAYEYNNNARFIAGRIEDVQADQIVELLGINDDVKVLVGCAPCQPFSTHTNKYKKSGEEEPEDERWFLLNHFSRLVGEVHPDIISMENVPQLAKQEIFADFIKKLKGQGYHVSWSVVNCLQYGIPQSRNRLVLLASRFADIKLIPPTHNKENYVTVQQSIGDMPPISAGEVHHQDALHRTSRLSELNLKRIRSSKPGGTWRDWDNSLLCECHKKETGSTYPSVYARMEWGAPAPTINTEFYNYGTGRFGHPSQDRAITLREGALLQTFPPEYKFTDGNVLSLKQVGKMIGNAVPVRLGEVVGHSIIAHLEERGVRHE